MLSSRKRTSTAATTTSPPSSYASFRRKGPPTTARSLRFLPPALMDEEGQGVAEIAQLYLGNILYALERAALALDEQNKTADAAFYRGIARKLAEARGKESKRARETENPDTGTAAANRGLQPAGQGRNAR